MMLRGAAIGRRCRPSATAQQQQGLEGCRTWLLDRAAGAALGSRAPCLRGCATASAASRERLVVLGTGWAGFRVLNDIDDKKFEVSVISPRNHLLFTPMLASSALGTVNQRSICQPVRPIVAKKKANFYESRVQSINREEKLVVARHGYCHLPNFLRPEAVVGLVGECRRLEADGRGFRSHEAHNVFLEDAGADGVGLRSKEFASSKVLMAMDDMEPRSALLAIYRWPALRRFLQDAFGLPRLFRSADPLGGAYYNIFDGAFGDTLGWHFDRSSFSTSLILQTTPGAGGDFQYAPDSRQAICEMGSWEEVEQHLDGRVLTPPLHPGSLYLFAGNRSLHRVSPVAHGKRINAIFTFVEEEGATLNEYTLRKFFGRTGQSKTKIRHTPDFSEARADQVPLAWGSALRTHIAANVGNLASGLRVWKRRILQSTVRAVCTAFEALEGGSRGPEDFEGALRIAVALIRGLAQVPAGRARARECAARRADVRKGLAQVRAALGRLEAELGAPRGPEPQRHAGCLAWAAQMLTGLHTAARALRTLEGPGAPEQEYEGLLRAVGELRARLRRAAAAAAAEGPPPAAPDDGARGPAEERRRPGAPRDAAGVRQAAAPAPGGRSVSGGALAQLKDYLACALLWEGRQGKAAGELPAALEVGALPKEASAGSSSTACSAGRDGGAAGWADSGDDEAGSEGSGSLSL
ncbi:unnamed protein product [Prorocentrum cordatum]|uniref:Fe2OG dioxygenase domain-containing protein n=1 Tax=Prorocentrum cordatum TaxID=2364126 RepID=A0ABN9TSH9_9DINO|nr:unnamed protein product [Polarella glacialis]